MMKFRHLVAAVTLPSLSALAQDPDDILEYVDPLIGTVDGGTQPSPSRPDLVVGELIVDQVMFSPGLHSPSAWPRLLRTVTRRPKGVMLPMTA